MLSAIHQGNGIDRETEREVRCAQQGGDSPIPSPVLLRPHRECRLSSGHCTIRGHCRHVVDTGGKADGTRSVGAAKEKTQAGLSALLVI